MSIVAEKFIAGLGDRIGAGAGDAADGRHLRVGAAQLRRHHVGEPFAHDDQRLPPLLQRAHVDDQALERREGHLVPNPLDRLDRVVRVLLLDVVHRRVVVLPAGELLDALDDGPVVARHPQVEDRLQRIHQADHVGGPELPFDEPRERIADAHALNLPDVVVVEEDREQADVVSRRLRLFVFVGADGAGRTVRAGHRAAIELDELEAFDRLRLAVLGDFEVALFQIRDVRAALVGDDDVHADEVDPGAKGRLRGLGVGRGLLSCCWARPPAVHNVTATSPVTRRVRIALLISIS